jgi:peptide/nickel transport system substrate-binding protein
MQLSIETLLRGQLDGTMSPGLVLSYDTVVNPPSVTLHLRKGVKFQDGTDFNAQAVKWNLEQVKAGPANAATAAYWKSFEVIDDYTIKINYTVWQNRLLTAFGMPSSNQVSPTAFEKNGVAWMRTHMVGTGPFIQTSYQQDVTTTAKRNPDYWETGKPYLDNISYLYVADQLTRMALFKSGGAEAYDLNGNGQDANTLKAAGYHIFYQQTGIDVLAPDGKNADSPWSNPLVRQAAEYAIDKVALNNAFGYGYNEVAYQICSPSESVYDKNFTGARVYDTAKAKQLLAQAGYPDGFKTRIIAQDTVNRDKIVAIQAYLAKVGINCDLEFAGAGQMSAYIIGGAGWHNALVYGYIFEWPNENYGLNLWFGVPTAWYPSLGRPDGWKDALAASLVTPEPDPTMIKKLIRMFYDDCTAITLDYPAQLTATTQNVQDSGIYTRIQNYYWNPQDVWLSK